MSDRLHVVKIKFENGNEAIISVRDYEGSTPALHVEGLNHVVKSSLESHDIALVIQGE